MLNYHTYMVCFLAGLLVTLLVTPSVMRWAIRVGAIDEPANRKIHKAAVPLFGGVGIFLGMWAPVTALSFYNNLVAQQVRAVEPQLFAVMWGGLAMLVVGLVDDVRGLNAKWKFAAQFPLAIALVAVGIRFDSLSFPYAKSLNLGTLGPIISVLWLVGITNALNLIDGIDGLASGVAVLISTTLGILAVLEGRVLLAVVMFSMAGACVGFLRYNFSPAQIFLGDSGSLFLGMTLAVCATLSSVKARVGTSLLAPVILLGYPIADTLLAMVRRYLRGRPVFSGDASHIHHRLIFKGLDHRKACLVIYTVCLGFCLWTLAITRGQLSGTYLGFMAFLLVTLAGINYLGYLNFFRPPTVPFNHYKVAYHFAEMIKAKMDCAHSPDEVLGLLRQVAGEFRQACLSIELPAGALGPGRALTWPEAGSADATVHGALREGPRDQYAFEDTGLLVRAWYEAHDAANELWTERRTLFEQICQSANHRLAQMARKHWDTGRTAESAPSAPSGRTV